MNLVINFWKWCLKGTMRHNLQSTGNILMLTKIYKHFFGILAKDKIIFFGSGKVAYPSALKLH